LLANNKPEVLEKSTDLALKVSLDLDEESSADQKSFERVRRLCGDLGWRGCCSHVFRKNREETSASIVDVIKLSWEMVYAEEPCKLLVQLIPKATPRRLATRRNLALVRDRAASLA
jgi:hypothetical protein